MKLRSIFVCALCLLLLSAAALAVEVETIRVTAEDGTASGNLAPIAENLELTTYRGVSVGGVFQAVDPEGDLIRFRLCTEPLKGTVTVDGSEFVYTPLEGKKGRDLFSYEAVDACGNVSAEASVLVRIEKQSTKVCYGDLEGSPLGYAALRLAEEGVFTGERMGGVYCFTPDAAVTRGEFLAMCAAMTGLQPLEGVTKTGFFDDDSIGPWLKPYVSAALMRGAVQGSAADNGRVVFRSGEDITLAESAVMLDNFLELSDMTGVWNQDSDVPFWAVQSVANLQACDICAPASFRAESALTRGEAAQMLSAAMDVAARRDRKST